MLWSIDHPFKNYLKAFDKIRKIAIVQEDGLYNWLFTRLQLFQTILEALDIDSKAIKQINFTENIAREKIQIQECFSLLKKQKKPF